MFFEFLAQRGDAGKLWFSDIFQVTSVPFPICMFPRCVSPWCETDQQQRESVTKSYSDWDLGKLQPIFVDAVLYQALLQM